MSFGMLDNGLQRAGERLRVADVATLLVEAVERGSGEVFGVRSRKLGDARSSRRLPPCVIVTREPGMLRGL